MPEIIDFEDFENRNRRNMARNGRKIRKIYEDAISEVSLVASRIKLNDQVFEIAKYPQLQKKVDSLLKSMQAKIYTTAINGIEEGWSLSNEKNDLIVDRRLGKRKPSVGVKKLIYDPNREGLISFIQRKENGLGLSDRVWNSIDPFKNELEKGLGLGIADGKSAAAMAKEMKQYLNEPDRLFRRVRDASGKLRLSKAARDYHPGQGVYRSSYKNALRLTRTEQNMAYRTADHERWKTLPFITGFDVKLSNAHPKYDICDTLAGQYPKGFKFTGWHPQCICFAVPKFVSDAEYNKIEDALLDGREPDLSAIKTTERPPSSFSSYYQANKDRIASWANKPYWVKENGKYLSKPATPVPVPVKKPKGPLTVTNYITDPDSLSKVRFTTYDSTSQLAKYSVTKENIMNLSGGLPIKDSDNYKFFISTYDKGIFATEAEFSTGDVSRRIDFEKKVIYNNLMKLSDKGQGVGTNLFINQVQEARKFGFEYLDVHAAQGGKWDGYHRWARLGYQMNDDYQIKFEDLMRRSGRIEKTVGQLVKTVEGSEFWKANGFYWEGKFFLKDGSSSMNHLIEYLESKKINVNL